MGLPSKMCKKIRVGFEARGNTTKIQQVQWTRADAMFRTFLCPCHCPRVRVFALSPTWALNNAWTTVVPLEFPYHFLGPSSGVDTHLFPNAKPLWVVCQVTWWHDVTCNANVLQLHVFRGLGVEIRSSGPPEAPSAHSYGVRRRHGSQTSMSYIYVYIYIIYIYIYIYIKLYIYII